MLTTPVRRERLLSSMISRRHLDLPAVCVACACMWCHLARGRPNLCHLEKDFEERIAPCLVDAETSGCPDHLRSRTKELPASTVHIVAQCSGIRKATRGTVGSLQLVFFENAPRMKDLLAQNAQEVANLSIGEGDCRYGDAFGFWHGHRRDGSHEYQEGGHTPGDSPWKWQVLCYEAENARIHATGRSPWQLPGAGPAQNRAGSLDVGPGVEERIEHLHVVAARRPVKRRLGVRAAKAR